MTPFATRTNGSELVGGSRRGVPLFNVDREAKVHTLDLPQRPEANEFSPGRHGGDSSNQSAGLHSLLSYGNSKQ